TRTRISGPTACLTAWTRRASASGRTSWPRRILMAVYPCATWPLADSPSSSRDRLYHSPSLASAAKPPRYPPPPPSTSCPTPSREQAIERRSQRFPGSIPQGDTERSDGIVQQATWAHPIPHPGQALPRRLNLQHMHPHQLGTEFPRRLRHCRDQPLPEGNNIAM